ncbi:MAG: hypothetical protein KAT68_09020 [Bacteroidales bacterium]|nr:hypothetical protein [Bacteroidales bacterium]
MIKNKTLKVIILSFIITLYIPGIIFSKESIASETECVLSLLPESPIVSENGEDLLITVTTLSHDCRWTASTNVNWIRLEKTSGTGKDRITARIRPNESIERSGIISVNSHSIIITQEGTGTSTDPPDIPSEPNIVFNCGTAILSIEGLVPLGETWYWQGTSCGISTSNSSIEYEVTNSGIYYLRARNNNSELWSECRSKEVRINLETIGGTVSGSKTICEGESTGVLTLSGHRGKILLWESRKNGGTWSDLIINNTTTYSTTPESVGTYEYRALVQQEGCESEYSEVAIITVTPATVGGRVTCNSVTCINSSIGLTLRDYTGTILMWQKKFGSSGTWTNISKTTTYITDIPGGLGGWYYRAVVKSGDCAEEYSDYAVVYVKPLPSKLSITPDGTVEICNGDNIQLTATEGYRYLWSNGEDTRNINVTEEGTYTVRQKSAYGCIGPASNPTVVSYNTPPKPSISKSGPTTFCQGENVTLTSSSSTSYLWSNGATTRSITVFESGNYRVTVFNSAGCSSPLSNAVNVICKEQVRAGYVESDQTTMELLSCLLTLQGNGAYPLDGTISRWMKKKVSSEEWITLFVDGTYPTVHFTDPQDSPGTWEYKAVVIKDGCTGYSESAIVTITPGTIGGQTVGKSQICLGNSTGLIYLDDNIGEVQYWEKKYEDGEWNKITGSDNYWDYEEIPGEIGTYYYRAVVKNGDYIEARSSALELIVEETPAKPTITYSGNLTLCDGETVTLTSSSGYSYLWSNDSITRNITVSSSGNYTVQIIGENACSSPLSNPVNVTKVQLSAGYLCSNQIIMESASCLQTIEITELTSCLLILQGNDDYPLNGTTSEWRKKKVSSEEWISLPVDGTYPPVHFTDPQDSPGEWEYKAVVTKDGCTGYSESAIVTITPGTIGGQTIGKSQICLGNSTGLIYLDDNVGEVQYWEKKYEDGEWNKITGSDNYWDYEETPGETGTYYYRAVVKNGDCIEARSSALELIVNESASQPVITADGPIEFQGGESVTLTSSAADSYLWSDGSETQSITVKYPGDYYVYVTNSHGCISQSSNIITIIVNQDPLQVNYEITEINENTFNVSINVTGGIPPYTYLWSTGDETVDLFSITSGTYTITVNDDYTKSTTKRIYVFSNNLNIGNYNYIYTITPRVPIDDLEDYEGIISVDMEQTVQYFDGLGRPVQNIIIQESPRVFDIVQHIEYDDFGRQTKTYLPFTTVNNGNYIADTEPLLDEFYSGSENVAATDYYYAEKVFDNSPLNRITEQGAPGLAWKVEKDKFKNSNKEGHTIKYNYSSNTNDKVKLIVVENDGFSSFEYYEEEELYFNIIINENNNISREYKDKQGKVILKQTESEIKITLSTYYVYDDFGLLRYVIPPEAVEQLGKNDWEVTGDDDIFKNYCYSYSYDERNRMIEKKIPGADIIYMVYDKLDRLVLTQDGNLRLNKKWSYIKYDILNRPVMTGIYMDEDNITRSDMQQAVYDHEFLSEERRPYVSASDFEIYHGYEDQTFPEVVFCSECEIRTVTYYDNYDFNNNGTNDYVYNTDETDIENTPYYFVKGKVTGTKTKVLETDQWITSVNFYDKYSRLIQAQTIDHYEYEQFVTSEYDFIGKILITEQKYYCDENIETVEEYEYDNSGRLLITKHSVNSSLPVIMSENHYNELGELIEKNLHSTNNGVSSLQSVDYSYNIRGWLTSINNPEILSDDLFGMELIYNEGFADLQGDAQYNGNISGIKWQTAYNNGMRGYGFNYDKINRLKQANYDEYVSGSWNSIYKDAFTVWNINYDLNGNIGSLFRNKFEDPLHDNFNIRSNYLDYEYNQSNQLYGISDVEDDYTGEIPVGSGTFKEQQYFYDANGNLKQDLNKGIENIEYNYLNLPTLIDFDKENRIEYTYTTDGTKLRKEVYGSGKLISFKDYFGAFEFNVDGLEFIHTNEGRIVPYDVTVPPHGGTLTKYRYEYFLKDHLGNVRVVFTDKDDDGEADLLSEDSYYPFGLTMGGLSYISGDNLATNLYKYNGKEEQNEFGYAMLDYGARHYDAQLGRFFTIDPLAETYNFQSPYVYAINNPIRFTDYMGMGPEDEVTNPPTTVHTSNLPVANEDYTPGDNSVPTKSETNGNTTKTYEYKGSREYSLVKEETTVLKESDWETQQNGNNDGNCFTASAKMVKNGGAETEGKSTEILVANHDANGVVISANGNINTGIDVIDNAIDNGKPIMVGVDYKSVQTDNKTDEGGDGMTDHAITFVGRTRTYSNGTLTGTSYPFFDSRTENSFRGTHSSNTLQKNSNNLIKGGYYNNTKTYTVTTIRRSK